MLVKKYFFKYFPRGLQGRAVSQQRRYINGHNNYNKKGKLTVFPIYSITKLIVKN